MGWSKEELEKKSKEELIDIIIEFQEEYEKEFFPGLEDFNENEEVRFLKSF